jgi:DNA-binding PadR family transcriptional regulator
VNTQSLIPLKPDLFQLLLVLLDGEAHGYALMQKVAQRTDGEVRILPGALYRHLQRMLELGMIEERERRRAPDTHDERRRYYAITPLGRRVAEVEAARLAKLVERARAKDLLKSPGPA